MVELLLAILGLGIVAALVSTYLGNARGAAQEAAAIATLRAINAAQTAYASGCASAGFAQSLNDLGRVPAEGGHAFIPPDLAANGAQRDGYVFTMQVDTGSTIVTPVSRVCNAPAKHAMSGYFVSATPAAAGTRLRTFATDKRRVIYAREDGIAVSPGMYGAVPLQ
mgnify:CR=1 FL=1